MLLLSSESSSGRSISSMAPAAFRQRHEQKCMPRLKATQIKANKAISHADSRTCSDANNVLFLSSESSSGKSMSSLAPAACRRWHEQNARCQLKVRHLTIIIAHVDSCRRSQAWVRHSLTPPVISRILHRRKRAHVESSQQCQHHRW